MVQKESVGRRKRGRPRGFDPEAVLDRARDAFWNTGYAATSLDDISAATGLNRPSLYGAFGGKQALYLAALQKTRTEMNAALAAAMAPQEPLRAALKRVYSAAATTYTRGALGQRGCFLIGTAVTEAVSDPEVRHTLDQALAEIDAAFEARLRRARDVGEIAAGLDVKGLAMLATATMNGMAVRARAGADQASLAAFGDTLIALICGPT